MQKQTSQTTGLELGRQRETWSKPGRGGEDQQGGLRHQLKGIAGWLEYLGSHGAFSEVLLERWVRRQCKWEAQGSNSLGGFPGRRKGPEHWDLENGPAGTSKTLLGGGGQDWDLPLLMEEVRGRETLPPHGEVSSCGPHPRA